MQTCWLLVEILWSNAKCRPRPDCVWTSYQSIFPISRQLSPAPVTDSLFKLNFNKLIFTAECPQLWAPSPRAALELEAGTILYNYLSCSWLIVNCDSTWAGQLVTRHQGQPHLLLGKLWEPSTVYLVLPQTRSFDSPYFCKIFLGGVLLL